MFRAVQLVAGRRTKSLGQLALSGFVNDFSSATNSQRLAGKVAVITGAASGIGKATATEFIKNGAKVIIADVQDDLGRSVAAELGPDAAYTRCDVSDEAQIAAAVDLAIKRHGHLDILYNNAGISGSFAENTKHAARVMAPRRRGSILCTASVMGVLTSGSLPAYAISKATVIGIVRAVAGPLARDGVRVNAISPHAIMTPLKVHKGVGTPAR